MENIHKLTCITQNKMQMDHCLSYQVKPIKNSMEVTPFIRIFLMGTLKIQLTGIHLIQIGKSIGGSVLHQQNVRAHVKVNLC